MHMSGLWGIQTETQSGMQTFKQYLELFIDPVFDSLSSGQQTTAAAAGEFIGQVRDLLGPNIWAGRLTYEQQQTQASSPHVPPPSGEAPTTTR